MSKGLIINALRPLIEAGNRLGLQAGIYNAQTKKGNGRSIRFHRENGRLKAIVSDGKKKQTVIFYGKTSGLKKELMKIWKGRKRKNESHCCDGLRGQQRRNGNSANSCQSDGGSQNCCRKHTRPYGYRRQRYFAPHRSRRNEGFDVSKQSLIRKTSP